MVDEGEEGEDDPGDEAADETPVAMEEGGVGGVEVLVQRADGAKDRKSVV